MVVLSNAACIGVNTTLTVSPKPYFWQRPQTKKALKALFATHAVAVYDIKYGSKLL